MKKVAIIGTVGVPASYGGFETLVENMIGKNASEDVEYLVYCSGKSYKERLVSYKGAKLDYISLKANGFQSTPYDIISMIKTTNKFDVALVLGVSGCIFLPIFRLWFKKKLIVNIDIDTVLVANRLTEIGHAMLYRLSAVGRAIVKNRMFF